MLHCRALVVDALPHAREMQVPLPLSRNVSPQIANIDGGFSCINQRVRSQ